VIRWLRKRFTSDIKRDVTSSSDEVVLPFVTDLHSHLLPGIDDGVETVEESLVILQGMERLGYRHLIMTPHVMEDSYRNETGTILEKLDLLRDAVQKAGIGVTLEAAAEYYMDGELLARLASRDILTIGSERFLLFETSYYSEPLNLSEMIYEMAASGYRPLLAHPERYRYVTDPEAFYGALRETGVRFQVTLNSFGGFYGRDAMEKALWLARKGWIDVLGSDLHSRRHMEFHRKTIRRIDLKNVLKKNPIINDSLMRA